MARGSADRYFQQDIKDQLKLVPEGVEGRVGYKGPVAQVDPPAGRRAAGRHGLHRQRRHRRTCSATRGSAASPAPACARATCTTWRSAARRRTTGRTDGRFHRRLPAILRRRRVTPAARIAAAIELLAAVERRREPARRCRRQRLLPRPPLHRLGRPPRRVRRVWRVLRTHRRLAGGWQRPATVERPRPRCSSGASACVAVVRTCWRRPPAGRRVAAAGGRSYAHPALFRRPVRAGRLDPPAGAASPPRGPHARSSSHARRGAAGSAGLAAVPLPTASAPT